MDVGNDFELVAAALRADTSDLRAFLEALAAKLEGAFPSRVHVERHGGVFGGGKRVRRIAVTLGDREYALEPGDGDVRCSRRTLVRGVALKTESPPLADWIDDLSQALVDEADRTGHDRAAAERMLLPEE